MNNKNLTVLMLIVDQSGSMGVIKEESQQALDALVKAQMELPGELMIKTVTFNHNVTVNPLRDWSKVGNIVLEPQGMTALHDAMVLGMRSLETEIKKLNEDDNYPNKVIIVTLTDGAENASREYKAESVKGLVEDFEKTEGWEFLFLGANQDAIVTAQQFGIRAGAAITYEASAKGIDESIRATTRYISDTRSGLKTEFTDEERNKSGLTGL